MDFASSTLFAVFISFIMEYLNILCCSLNWPKVVQRSSHLHKKLPVCAEEHFRLSTRAKSVFLCSEVIPVERQWRDSSSKPMSSSFVFQCRWKWNVGGFVALMQPEKTTLVPASNINANVSVKFLTFGFWKLIDILLFYHRVNTIKHQ